MANHIKHIHDDNKTWCGETVGNEFYFKSVDHAVLNGMGRSQLHTHLVTCEACTTLIIENLLKGQQPLETEITQNE
jgi:hypothetical protein